MGLHIAFVGILYLWICGMLGITTDEIFKKRGGPHTEKGKSATKVEQTNQKIYSNRSQ